MLLFGKPGQGKSTFGNLLVCRKAFRTGGGMAHLTTEPGKAECESPDGALGTVTDIPGFEIATVNTEEIARSVKFAAGSDNETQPGVDVLLYVVACNVRFESDHQLLLEYLDHYGTGLWQFLIVIFTHAVELGSTAREQKQALTQLARQNNTLRWLMNNIDQQFVLFENEGQDEAYRGSIIAEVWDHVMQIRRKTKGKCYTCPLLTIAQNESESTVQEMVEEKIARVRNHKSGSAYKEQREKSVSAMFDNLDRGLTAVLDKDSTVPAPARQIAQYAISHTPCISGRSTPTATGNLSAGSGMSSAATGRASATSDGCTASATVSVNSNNSYHVNCFPSSATVLTSNGSKSMRDLDTGEKVLCLSQNGSPIFSEVITFIHHEPNQRGKYLTISTKRGTSITLSPNHLTFIASSKPGHPLKTQPILAANVKPGHYLVSWSAELHRPVLTVVTSVCTTVEQGVYAPLTRCGVLLVDGIMASCYANTEKHSLAHCAFAPLRMYTSLRIKQHERRPKHGIHQYAKFLTAFSKLVPKSVYSHV